MRTQRPPRMLFPAIGLAAALVFETLPSLGGDEPGSPAHQAAGTTDRVSASRPGLSDLRPPPVEPDCTKAVVFLYHGFNRGPGALSVDVSTLDAHLEWLRRNEVSTISMDALVEFLEGRSRLPARVALLAIDDGDATVHSHAWPVLKRHGARFVLGLPTRLMESGHPALLRWDQVREMVDSGLAEVASHGHVHQGLVHFGADRAARELALSRQIIRDRTGRLPVAFFYPLGAVDQRAERFVRDAGFSAAFTAEGGPIVHRTAPRFRIPRVTVEHGRASLAGFYGARFWQPAKRFRSTCAE